MRQKINKETQIWKWHIDQVGLIDLKRMLHPKAAEYIFFLRTLEIFSRVDHILGHKSSLDKLEENWIMSYPWTMIHEIRNHLWENKTKL